MVSAITEFQSKFGVASAQWALAISEFKKLVSVVAQTVSTQPLTYFKNFVGGTNEFIFERADPS